MARDARIERWLPFLSIALGIVAEQPATGGTPSGPLSLLPPAQTWDTASHDAAAIATDDGHDVYHREFNEEALIAAMSHKNRPLRRGWAKVTC